jgi:hypothetical protein
MISHERARKGTSSGFITVIGFKKKGRDFENEKKEIFGRPYET